MKRWISGAALMAVTVTLWCGLAFAQAKPECDKAKTPHKLEGQVVAIDLNQGKVTMRGSDGATHEFQASKETLQGYKVGDRIEAKLRSAPECKSVFKIDNDELQRRHLHGHALRSVKRSGLPLNAAWRHNSSPRTTPAVPLS